MSRPNESRSRDKQKWTPEQDLALMEAVARVAPTGQNIVWSEVAGDLPGRNNKSCRKRWHYKIAHNFTRGPWSPGEDQRLCQAVQLHGTKWRRVSEVVKTRNGDQCWKRWHDSVDPKIDHSPWTAKEDSLLMYEVERSGRRWQEIVDQHFPSRTALAAKNRHALLQRRSETGTELGRGPENQAKTQNNSIPDCNLFSESLPGATEADSFINQKDFFSSMDLMDFGSGTFDPSVDKPGVAASNTDMDHTNYSASSMDINSIGEFQDLTAYTTPVSLSPSVTTFAGRKTIDAAVDTASGHSDLSSEGSTISPVDSNRQVEVYDVEKNTRAEKVLLIHTECASGRVEPVMDKLSRAINEMMISGDIKNVGYSVR
ncbi:hypothetical protein F4779DRAFT_601871 [Xylariaceae sp. FL0662B]|nr:hypothetical protein F4779DRAFT_601871 [Xylariaceae sp. FL0662B]